MLEKHSMWSPRPRHLPFCSAKREQQPAQSASAYTSVGLLVKGRRVALYLCILLSPQSETRHTFSW